MLFSSTKQDWFGNIRGDVLAGLVVALALIPEAIAFSIIAEVDPKVGLYASFSIAVVTAFVGGRPGMISAATGAMALLMVTLVKVHGLQYLLAATILTGVIQMLMGFLKLGSLMSFVSRSVVTGFVNALAILIFMAQLPELTNVTWHVYAMTIVGLGIIYGFPLVPVLGKILPSPLVTIILLTIVAVVLDLDIRTVGDMGELPDTLPIFFVPEIAWTFETLKIIFPYSMSLAASDKNRECKGQGLANIATGFLGGMAGCAMIGQSVINVRSGGRGRLSTLVAGVVLLILVVFLNDFVNIIPMAALVAVMIMVSIGTFDWNSIRNLKTNPKSSSIVMMVTVAVVVYTHNLAYGVFIGVLLAALFFARKVSRYMSVEVEKRLNESLNVYKVYGEVFFNSAAKFVEQFDYKEVVDKVVIDLSRAHFWDISAVSALDKVILKFRREGTQVKLIGLNKASETMVDRFGIHDKPDELGLNLGEH